MSRRTVLGAGIVVAVVAVLGVAAYIVIAQTCSGGGGTKYTPSAYSLTVNPGATAEVCFPHYMPFRLVVGYMGFWGGGTVPSICGATGFVMASENSCNVSWVGQNGNGTTTVGCNAMGSGTTILTVGPTTVRLTSSSKCTDIVPVGGGTYFGHTLQIVNTGNSAARVTLMY